MVEKYCSFFGHRDFVEDDNISAKIKNIISDCVSNKNIYNFLLGGYGHFDYCCAKYINELKSNYPEIRIYLVLAYINKKLDQYDKNFIQTMYDDILYPPIEKTPLKYSIVKRNEWMVENSQFVIFYVNKTWGGASKMLEYTQKKKIKFINVADI